MSYDLDVYSPTETAFERGELTAALHQRGWRVVFLHQDAFWKDDVWPFLPQAGALDSFEIMLAAWPLKNELAPQLEALVQAQNFGEFKALVEETMVLAVCSLSLTTPYDARANFAEDEWKEFEANCPEAAKTQSQARSHYYLRTSGGRGPFAIEFQHAAWEAIAQIAGGVAENPQEGAFDWEELIGEKPSLLHKLKVTIFNWRYARSRKKYGL